MAVEPILETMIAVSFVSAFSMVAFYLCMLGNGRKTNPKKWTSTPFLLKYGVGCYLWWARSDAKSIMTPTGFMCRRFCLVALFVFLVSMITSAYLANQVLAERKGAATIFDSR